MKMDLIDWNELSKVEELEEKSAPAFGGPKIVLPDTILWDSL